MSIVLFSKKDFRGESIRVTADLPRIKDTGLDGRPSSLQLTTAGDRLLLFKQEGFGGACLFRRGPATIPDLGDKDAGGKFGFGNAVESARLTPFDVDVHAVVIRNAKGVLPGGLPDRDAARALARQVLTLASDLWEPFLLRLDLAEVDIETDDRHFDVVLDRLVRFPLSFYQRGRVNVFFVNSFRVAGGVTRPPCLGELVAVPVTLPTSGPLPPDILACALAHEFGHHVGLHHPGAKNDPTNIMNTPLVFPVANVRNLTEEQVSDAHTALARNPARRGQRQG